MKLPEHIFRAYDVRGRYPEEINETTVASIIEQIPKLLKGKVVVGHDARLSSPALYKTVIASLKKTHPDSQIECVGSATTPMLYFLVQTLKARAGIMITASHNPKDYNGLKVTGPGARPVSGETIKKLVIGR